MKIHAEEQAFAMIFLRQAGDCYDEVRRELKNNYPKGNDNIPMTVDEAYSLLQLYQVQPVYISHISVVCSTVVFCRVID